MQKSEGKKKRTPLTFDKVLVLVSTLSLASIVLINLLNIFMRFLLNKPLFWSLEVSSILAVWFTFIVFGVNYKENQHFRIDVLVNTFTEKVKAWHAVLTDLVLFVILCFVLYSGIVSFFRNYQMTLPSTGIPSSIALYLPFIIGTATYLVFIVVKYVKKFSARS